MTEREIRRLNREALLELLIQRTEENEALQARLEEMKAQLEAAQRDAEAMQQAAEARQTGAVEGRVMEAGSLAEAAVQISGVFEAAEQAANVYLESIRHMQEEQIRAGEAALEESRRQAARIEADARAQAEALLADARSKAEEHMAEVQRQCAEQESETRRRCDEMLAEARQDPSRKLFELSSRVDQIIRENAELRGMIAEQPAKKRKWRL